MLNGLLNAPGSQSLGFLMADRAELADDCGTDSASLPSNHLGSLEAIKLSLLLGNVNGLKLKKPGKADQTRLYVDRFGCTFAYCLV